MRAALAAVALLCAVCPAAAGQAVSVDPQPAAPQTSDARVRLPAAAVARISKVRVRSAPRAQARVTAVMRELRYDYRPTIFQVVGRAQDAGGATWFRVPVPGRPNGRRGWVEAASLDLTYSVASSRIVIDRSARRLRLVRNGRKILSGPVAVGKAGAPTPLGRFYLTAGFRPSNDFLGPWAFETSAYAAITDWPRGGIVGLHGTSVPSSVGRRASHGCLRVFNRTILRLRRHVRLGTPLLIHR